MWPTAWRKQPFIKHSSVYYCLFWGSDWLKTQVKVQKCPAHTPPAWVLIGPRESRSGRGLNSSNLRPWSLQSSPEPKESKTNIYFKVLQLHRQSPGLLLWKDSPVLLLWKDSPGLLLWKGSKGSSCKAQTSALRFCKEKTSGEFSETPCSLCAQTPTLKTTNMADPWPQQKIIFTLWYKHQIYPKQNCNFHRGNNHI